MTMLLVSAGFLLILFSGFAFIAESEGVGDFSPRTFRLGPTVFRKTIQALNTEPLSKNLAQRGKTESCVYSLQDDSTCFFFAEPMIGGYRLNRGFCLKGILRRTQEVIEIRVKAPLGLTLALAGWMLVFLVLAATSSTTLDAIMLLLAAFCVTVLGIVRMLPRWFRTKYAVREVLELACPAA